jgi:hypothetical protein
MCTPITVSQSWSLPRGLHYSIGIVWLVKIWYSLGEEHMIDLLLTSIYIGLKNDFYIQLTGHHPSCIAKKQVPHSRISPCCLRHNTRSLKVLPASTKFLDNQVWNAKAIKVNECLERNESHQSQMKKIISLKHPMPSSLPDLVCSTPVPPEASEVTTSSVSAKNVSSSIPSKSDP